MAVARWKRFWELSNSLKFAVLEAAVLLAFAQTLVKLIPYGWWSRMLGPVGSGQDDCMRFVDDNVVEDVSWVIEVVARALPWKVVCLPRAMATKWMLARRNIASAMFVGVRRPDSDCAKDVDLHAWLRVGDRTISGGEAAGEFTVIARYGGPSIGPVTPE